jgi:hypothetical protein
LALAVGEMRKLVLRKFRESGQTIGPSLWPRRVRRWRALQAQTARATRLSLMCGPLVYNAKTAGSGRPHYLVRSRSAAISLRSAQRENFTGSPGMSNARLGEHNEEVLRELLCLSDKKITDLYADNGFVRDPLLEPSGGRQ